MGGGGSSKMWRFIVFIFWEMVENSGEIIAGIVSNKSAVTSKDVWGNGGEIVGNCRQY
jgi:hypothetical protein